MQAIFHARPLGNHFDYPSYQADHRDDFPFFKPNRFFDTDIPKDYVGSAHPVGLRRALAHPTTVHIDLPAIHRLKNYIEENGLGQKFASRYPNYEIDRLLNDCVEAYFHRYGIEKIDSTKRNKIIERLLIGALDERLPLAIVAPIAITRFSCDRYRLNGSAYLMRMRRPMQLSRSMISGHGSGAVSAVVGAATHAFISNGWTIPGSSLEEVRRGLQQSSPAVLNSVDLFLAALRLSTGIDTGVAQIFAFPKGWAASYYCDLPTLYGFNCRRYPNHFDNFGWSTGKGAMVTLAQLAEVAELYRKLIARDERQIAIAISRLNTCMTRDDDTDGLLDAVIGLEVLLGDDDKQWLMYKLSMRAAALLSYAKRGDPKQVLKDVKQVYGLRSALVHGSNKKVPKTVDTDPLRPHAAGRNLATNLLRTILSVLIEHPKFLDPLKIDSELMLGIPSASPEPQGRRKPH